MKTTIKIALLFVAFVITSCSPDDKKGGGEITPLIYPMEGSLDAGASKLMRNYAGTNLANPNSIEFGLNNYTLYGYFDNGSPDAKAPIQEKLVEINLAIPKENIALGEHVFANSLVVDEYFADLNIKTNGIVETVNTVGGKITVLTYDETTGIITGTFELTTTNGTDPLTHTFTGEFDYKLVNF